MVLKWNKSKIIHMLEEKEIIISNIMLNNPCSPDLKDLEFDTDILRYMLDRPMKYDSFSKGIRKCDYINESIFSLQSILIPKPFFIGIFEDYSERELINLIRLCIDDKDKELFEEMLSDNRIDVPYDNKDLNHTMYLVGTNQSYIKVSYGKGLYLARKLTHELGHASEFSDNLSLKQYMHLFEGNLSEVCSILNELIYLDKLESKISESKYKKAVYDFLLQYQSISLSDTPLDKARTISYLIAHYMFYHYKYNKDYFNEIFPQFKEFVLTDDDNTVLYKLDIKNSNVINAYKTYIKEYKNRV